MKLLSRRYLARLQACARHDQCPSGTAPKQQNITIGAKSPCRFVIFRYITPMPVIISKEAEKALRKMPANTAQTIREKIALLGAGGAALVNNITALKGSNYKRLRVGDWRVIFDDQGNIINILAVKPRGGAYK